MSGTVSYYRLGKYVNLTRNTRYRCCVIFGSCEKMLGGIYVNISSSIMGVSLRQRANEWFVNVKMLNVKVSMLSIKALIATVSKQCSLCNMINPLCFA